MFFFGFIYKRRLAYIGVISLVNITIFNASVPLGAAVLVSVMFGELRDGMVWLI